MRDKSRPNDARKRTCTSPWSRRDSRERHSARRYTRRRFRRRYLSPPKDDSIRPNRNVGRHRRHGHRNRLAALMNRRRSSVCIPHPHACLPAKDDQTSIELNCALQDRIAADRNMGAHAGHRRTPKRAVWNFCWHTEWTCGHVRTLVRFLGLSRYATEFGRLRFLTPFRKSSTHTAMGCLPTATMDGTNRHRARSGRMEVFDGKRNLWSQITAALTNENGTTTNASTAVAVIDMKIAP